jgi:hypothetical protein
MRTLLGLLLLTGTALADESPSADTTVTPRATRHGGKLGKRFSTEKGKPKTRAAVHGHCTLLESPLNPITGPCISVPLELKDEKGQSQGVSRTTVQGDFDFTVEGDGPYVLAPTSSHYVVVSPKEAVGKGKAVDLRIRERD